MEETNEKPYQRTGRSHMPPMNDFSDFFWTLIDQAHGSSAELETILEQQSKEALVRFHEEFELAHAILWDSEADIILREQHHASDDLVNQVFGDAILRGKVYYYDILENPEKIVSRVDPSKSLRGIAPQAYWNKFHTEIDSQ